VPIQWRLDNRPRREKIIALVSRHRNFERWK
jgi:hypothetical protein